MTTTLSTTKSGTFKTPIGWGGHNGWITTNVTTVKTLDTTNTTVTQQKYMRPVYIRFEGKGYKPYTTQTPYFDGIDVSAHTAPITEDIYNAFVELEEERNIGQTKAATTSTEDSTNGYNAAKEDQIWKANVGTSVKANREGNFWGIFRIPASTFPTGTTTLKFVDSDGNTTEATFTSSGELKTTYNTITTSVKVALSDPVAQSFYIDLPDNVQGCYLTSVGVFMKSKSNTEDMFLELRNLENGYPGQQRLAVVVVNPKDIVVSNSGADQYETKIKLPYPIYVDNKTGYAIVLRTNSTEYNVWCARMGEGRYDKDEAVDRNPYVGMLFRSANNDTWISDQTADMKFRIYRAKFKTMQGTNEVKAVVRHSILPPLTRTAYRTYIETFDNTSYFRVFAVNHGLFKGSKVGISISSSSPYLNGVHKRNLTSPDSKGLEVVYVDSTSFVVLAQNNNTDKSDTQANNTIFSSSGDGIESEMLDLDGDGKIDNFNSHFAWVDSITYDPNIHTDIMYVNQTKTEFAGTTIDNVFYPFYVNSAGLPTSSLVDSFEITENAEMQLDSKVLFPSYQELTRMDTGGRYPSYIVTTLSSDNDYMSPQLNLDSMSVITAAINFNNPARDRQNAGEKIYDPERDKEGMKVAFINYMAALERSVHSTESLMKYVTQPVELESDSTSIRILFAGNVSEQNYVSVFYRTLTTSESCDITEKDWINIPYEGLYSYASEEDEYYEYEYNVDDLPSFNKFQVKLVCWGDDKVVPVKLKDFRAIALAK